MLKRACALFLSLLICGGTAAFGQSSPTWEQVMKHPDDVELNYGFAQSQVDKGDLRGAAATLARILLVNADLPKVRVFYAVVLFRLDDLDESEREFKTVRSASLPESLSTEIDGYLGQIAKKRRRTHVDASLSLGFGYDDNRNENPSTGTGLFQNISIPLNGAKQKDTDILAMGNVRVARDLDSQAGHQLFATLGYVRDEQTVLKPLTLQDVSASVGGVYKTAFANYTPTLSYDNISLGQDPVIREPSAAFQGGGNHILLDQETFLRNWTAGTRMDKTLASGLVGHAEVDYSYQDFAITQAVPDANLRSGNQWATYAGVDYVLNPSQRLSTTFGYLHKNAVAEYYAYDRASWQASDTWLLGRGMFLLSSVTVWLDYYLQPDPITLHDRRDQTVIPRLTYGAPLGFIHKCLDTTLFTLTYQYYYAQSTVPNYAYTDNRVAAAFVYQWGY